MDLDSIRAYCLSFPQTREQLQWGESLLFKVAGKMFVIAGLEVARETRLAFKCTPEVYAELVEREGIHPARYNMWKFHWVAVERFDTIRTDELKDLIRQSYELIAAKAIKPKRDARKSAAKSTKRKV
ncbi:MAG TPA: MmcQ/YjbR family DNA-binding protein [Terriglobales bacterium]|nr:MmcQ/YjbR family DNA-binding protein [Terriglobales bacterium]